jgi:chaperone modulatory protein CbpM
MAGDSNSLLDGCILEEDAVISLAELCSACSVHAEYIIALVDEGILEPECGDTGAWRFAGTSLKRTRMVIHLERDLGVNIAGAALVLDLMEELEGLRAQLRQRP